MPYSAYCLFFVPPNKRLDPVLCSIGKWLIRYCVHTVLARTDITRTHLPCGKKKAEIQNARGMSGDLNTPCDDVFSATAAPERVDWAERVEADGSRAKRVASSHREKKLIL